MEDWATNGTEDEAVYEVKHNGVRSLKCCNCLNGRFPNGIAFYDGNLYISDDWGGE